MKFKDIEMLFKSVLHAGVSGEDCGCYWDTAGESDFKRIATNLSDPDTPEREKIRDILRSNDINSVLDAACGIGTEILGYKVNDMNIEYVGMDMSERMLNEARRIHHEYRFELGDVNSMPFPDQSFDAAVLKHILEHLPDYKSAVKEGVRVASKIVVIDFFHMLLPFDYRRMHKDGFWENWYSKKKFRNFLDDLPISDYEMFRTTGTNRQTAEIYVLHK